MWNDYQMGVDDTATRYCVCGQAVEERELPRGVCRLSGRTSILVHVETRSPRCDPTAENEVDLKATVRIDDRLDVPDLEGSGP